MHVVGLTGPTGSGKSEVTALWTARGIPVVDTDRLAREVVEPGEPCLAELVAAFSPAILQADGRLNRRALAARAFAAPESAARLSAITHPYIIARSRAILKALAAANEPLAVVDAPLLFESGMDALCDETVAIVAPEDTRRARIMRRDGLTAEQAAQRMAAQQPNAYYASRADRVMQNDGSLAALQAQAAALAEEWQHDT